MTQKHFIQLGPPLVLALGIVVSTLLAVSGSGSLWLVGAGVLLAAVSILGADILGAGLRGEPLVPSLLGIVAMAALLMACGIVALRDPKLVPMLIPLVGGGSTTVFLFNDRSRACVSRRRG
jgi:hypothetical protein